MGQDPACLLLPAPACTQGSCPCAGAVGACAPGPWVQAWGAQSIPTWERSDPCPRPASLPSWHGAGEADASTEPAARSGRCPHPQGL